MLGNPFASAHWQLMAAAWLALMAAIGALTVLVVLAAPRWRGRVPLLVPLLVGIAGTGMAATVVAPAGWSAIREVLVLPAPVVQQWVSRLPAPLALGGPMVAGLIIGVGLAWASFRLEAALLGWVPRPRAGSRAGLPVEAVLELLPARAESMDGVARVARTPALFLLVSAVSVTGEELFFRGAMLAPVWFGQPAPAAIWWSVLAQAVLFGLLHLTFGWRSVVSKILLGAGLALGALCAGLLLGAVLPHLLFQLRVLAQFRPAPARPRQEAVSA